MLHAHEKRVRLTVPAQPIASPWRACLGMVCVYFHLFIHPSIPVWSNPRWVRVSSAAEQTSGRRAARITENPTHVASSLKIAAAAAHYALLLR